MHDSERKQLPLKAVSVSETNNGGEYHHIGMNDVTKIEWATTNGHMAELLVVQVWKGDTLASEHPFANVLSVHYCTIGSDIGF